MKKIILIFCFLIPNVVSAGPYLICDCQDNVDYYEIIVDGGNPIQSTAVSAECTNNQRRISLDMEPLGLSDGQHSLTGKSCNVWGCSSSVPFEFRKGLPSTQSGIGLSVDQ